MRRVFLMVLDSVGIGEMPDADRFGDVGSHTLRSVSTSPYFFMPHMDRLGLFQIDGVDIERYSAEKKPHLADIARMRERSMGKDTTIGHWEIAGVISKKPLPVFPEGFPKKLLEKISQISGRDILCNRPYSGTKVIEDYGEESVQTGALIVYTSADSVLQIAAHEAVVPIKELYEICEKVREICTGDWGIGRIIARPFIGTSGSYTRTANRHDFSLKPPETTVLDAIVASGQEVIAIGKISDIFAGCGVTRAVRTSQNAEGIEQTKYFMQQDFEGLCFVNLVDYDMLYGHRNDVDGYAKALTAFDEAIPELLKLLQPEDLLLITADHGCDPATPSTDHSREYTPFLMIQKGKKAGCNLGTRDTFADIAATIADYLHVDYSCAGRSMIRNRT